MPAWSPPEVPLVLIDYVRQQLEKCEASHRLSQQQIDDMYALGVNWLRNGMPDRAHDVFTILRMYRPFEYRFLLGHALAWKQRRRFEDALGLFGAAAMVAPGNPEPWMHAGECLLASGRQEEAIDVMHRVVQLSSSDSRYAEIAERAEGWIALAEQHEPG